MPKLITIAILSFILGFVTRHLIDGVNIFDYRFYKVHTLDFTQDGYNSLRKVVFK